jgi:hypothetical protein
MPVFLRQGHIRNILQPIKDTQLAKIAGQQTDYTVLAGVRVTQVALACEAVSNNPNPLRIDRKTKEKRAPEVAIIFNIYTRGHVTASSNTC